ncbi:MAG: ABC transporter substrate-binding protein, partial [Clostridiales bacterium]|nr:ABC transporter substrate-binding protein [Clostridiales bacterium]
LASVLYKNTEKQVKVAAINALGVLYVVEIGDAVQSIEDLKGQTLVSTGKGTTPEYALNHVLLKNGIDPAADLTIEYKSESTEVAAALAGGTATLAMLPQPYVAVVQAQNPDVRVALSLTDEWAKADDGSALVTGVAVIRSAFIDEHPDLVASFLAEYAASAEYVNANPAEAALWIADLGIVPKAEIAQAAIPLSNIVCITGDDMKARLSGYLAALCEQNPAAVGGELPDDAFYYLT